MSIATTTRGGAVHWNGPPMRLTSCDGTRCRQAVEGIRRFHVQTRGWRDIAYNHLVCPGCGTVYTGRGWGVRSASNGTNVGNRDWHGWMVLSGEGEPFTDAAKAGILQLAAEHRRRFGHVEVTTHRKVRGGQTACPGDEIARWAEAGCPDPDPVDPFEEWWMSLTDTQRANLEALASTIGPGKLEQLDALADTLRAEGTNGKSFVRQLLAFHRDERPTLQEIIRHIEAKDTSVQGLVRGATNLFRAAHRDYDVDTR